MARAAHVFPGLQEMYNVERLVGKRETARGIEYKVKWEGYTQETWYAAQFRVQGLGFRI